MKRSLFFFVTGLMLIATLVGLWRLRFERLPNIPSLTLADLRSHRPVLPPSAVWTGSAEQPALRFSAGLGQPRVVLRMELPGFPGVEALHVRFRMAAKNLKIGPQKWDDGRALIEWHSVGAGIREEIDPFCSLRESESSGEVSLVARAASGHSIPVLRMEHLGRSGEFEVLELEMIPVKERMLWKSGRWVLLASWFGWIWLVLAGTSRPVWKGVLAAGIWLGMAVYFAVPGPWKTLRPMVTPFAIGMPVESASHENEPPQDRKPPPSTLKSPSAPPSPEALGMLPLQGGWIMQMKSQLAMLRPLLHSMLLFGPTLVLAWLVGCKSAKSLALGLAVSIEAAQTAFGYGFDWVDVFDLFCDGLGIALAIWLYQKISRRFESRRS